MERDLIQGEVVERFERGGFHRRLNFLGQLEPISVPLRSAAANFLSNPATPLQQRPDSHPEQECEVCNFLATENTSESSHQGVSLISTSLRYLLTTGLFILLPICQSWLFMLIVLPLKKYLWKCGL